MAGLLIVAAITACSPSTQSDDSDLTIFAAASLRDVFVDLEAAWLTTHPDTSLTLAHEASNVLAAQISEGAPADVFVSADTERPQQLLEAHLVAAEPVPFAGNRVALVVPTEGDRVQSPADLAEPGVRIVAAGRGVPITRYTDEALAQLALTMPDPEAFAAAVSSNIVSREDNVRAALAKVELGEGDAAIVFRTDAMSSDRVREIPLPAVIDITAEYAVVQVSDRGTAADLVEWLGGPEASDVIEAAGFEVVHP
ncbi:MAG: molybdate ABC transporter substrate-binding protein [Planctomycetota bacterium]|nr:MAG: molybdate ABC transporter substrate-binding protein [Planctomycetota bacterium]